MLKKLGVACVAGIADHNFRPDVTHVVSSAPKRNQKCLAALASGGWLLSPAWVHACAKAGALVPEAPHELASSVTEVEKRAAAHWRQRAAAAGARAFEGLRVHVTTALDKPFEREDITNVITAGGGQLVSGTVGKDPHLVITSTEGAQNKRLPALVAHGALVAGPMYVVDWLAQPKAALGQHMLLGSKAGPALAAAAAARGTMSSPAVPAAAGNRGPAGSSGAAGTGGSGKMDSDDEGAASDASILFD